MKANNLTISINAECDKACPFCISKMTWKPKPNDRLFYKNMQKAKNLATIAQVSSVLITSKGEPLKNRSMLESVCEVFKDFPLELQTNGTHLTVSSIGFNVDSLHNMGINTVAISITKGKDLVTQGYKITELVLRGINVRLTVMLTDMTPDMSLKEWVDTCHAFGVKQLTFRHTTIPQIVVDTDEAQSVVSWITENTKRSFNKLFDDIRSYMKPDNLIRRIPWGIAVYSIEGIAVTTIDYCIQESNNYDDIRSLIYHCDGHMYTAWDKPESVIF